MNQEERNKWFAEWAFRNKAVIDLATECGFGRECVGVTAQGHFPEYNWYDEKTWERIDGNGQVWTPPNAYHKHPCVAVLGRGEVAEQQLYEWLKWFEDNHFSVEVGLRDDVDMDPIRLIIQGIHTVRMVRAPVV